MPAREHSNEGRIALVPTKESIIRALELEPHIEGGYFKRTFESPHTTTGTRRAMSTIYYLLTEDSPIGYLHQNRSDIVHFFHSGAPIRYYLISPEGQLTKHTLGPSPELGHQFQLVVKGGYWKASHLLKGEYGLISEAVCPGFEYSDMQLVSRAHFTACYPEQVKEIEHLLKS